MEIASPSRLESRIKYILGSGQKITFLVGSGISLPTSKTPKGVPSVSSMIEIISSNFTSVSDLQELERIKGFGSPSKVYQELMRFVIEARGQQALNQFVKSAVLQARFEEPNSASEESLEHDLSGWSLAPGVDAIGRLVAKFPNSFQSPILTTNFDPLLEVAVRKHGGLAATVGLPSDGNFFNVSGGQRTTNVVHFHGFWRTGDMLHTPAQLNRDRPHLKGALRTLLRDTTLVVVAYGGWEDLFTKTLIEAISEHSDPLDVLWCCRDQDPTKVREGNPWLIDACMPLLGQRLIMYGAIDCHEFLPAIADELCLAPEDAKQGTPAISRKIFNLLPSSIPPPDTSAWVGRYSEMQKLLGQETGIIAINGFGGVGKSTLAARFLRESVENNRYECWAWLDCREQSNTVISNIADLLAAFSETNTRPLNLSDDQTVSLLVDILSRKKALIVFDNVDSYVDLEAKRLIGPLKLLVDRCVDQGMSSRIIITARPQINTIKGVDSLRLPGLTTNEIESLFKLRLKGRNQPSIEDYALIYEATKGNSLYINLVISQLYQGRISLSDMLDRMRLGVASNVEFSILDEIWAILNDKQRIVLRYLCESSSMQPLERIENYLQGSLTPNRLNRCLGALKSMDVVMEKVVGRDIYVELHPLVRAYVRNKFSRKEREPFIFKLVSICDSMIRRLRRSLASSPVEVYVYWLEKIELSVEAQDSASAIECLKEIEEPLRETGHGEQFIRLCTLVAEAFGFAVDESVKAQWDHIFKSFIEQLAYSGRASQMYYWIKRFETSLEGKSSRYVLLCDMQATACWILGDSGAAVPYAREGVELKKTSGVDTDHDCSHVLALALRESGEIDEALNIFLEGRDIQALLKEEEPGQLHHSSYYGNIGRALFLKGDMKGALRLIRRSGRMLQGERGHTTLLNRGWAAFWVGEILERSGEFFHSFCAYASAAIHWKECHPLKSVEARNKAAAMRERVDQEEVMPIGEREILGSYYDWLDRKVPAMS